MHGNPIILFLCKVSFLYLFSHQIQQGFFRIPSFTCDTSETSCRQGDTGLEMETIEILKKTYDDFEKRHSEEEDGVRKFCGQK